MSEARVCKLVGGPRDGETIELHRRRIFFACSEANTRTGDGLVARRGRYKLASALPCETLMVWQGWDCELKEQWAMCDEDVTFATHARLYVEALEAGDEVSAAKWLRGMKILLGLEGGQR